MTLPFEPQTVSEMSARWPAALSFEYNQSSIIAGGIRPGECRANVFDFASGLRVIASVERTLTGVKVLHVSASFEEGTDEYRSMERLLVQCRGKTGRAVELWARTVENRVKQIAGSDAEGITFCGMTHRGIPHWNKEIKEDGGVQEKA